MVSPEGSRGGAGGLSEHQGPRVADVAEESFDRGDGSGVFVEVGLLKLIDHEAVEGEHGGGKFAAIFHIESLLELANDPLGFD